MNYEEKGVRKRKKYRGKKEFACTCVHDIIHVSDSVTTKHRRRGGKLYILVHARAYTYTYVSLRICTRACVYIYVPNGSV